VGALLQAPVELRQGDDRAVELLGQRLERARNLGNLVDPAVAAGTGNLHQLQVVDHDQADLAVLARQAPSDLPHFRWGNTGGIVDEQLAIVEQVDRAGQARPVIVVELTGTHLGLVNTPQRGEHTNDDGLRRHLQRVDEDRLVAAHQGVFHQVHGEGGIIHRRTACNDDHVGRLQAAGEVVQVIKAGGQTGNCIAVVEQRVDAVDGLDQNVVDAHRATGFRPVLGDLEDLALGLVENLLAGTAFRRIGTVGDLVADADQFAQGGALTNDLRIGLDVGYRRCVLRQFGEISQATDLRQLPLLVQLFGQGDDVEGLVTFGQLEDRAEDQTMVMAVEIAIGNTIEHTLPSVVVEHQATQYRLLRLDGVRRHFQGSSLQVVLLGNADVVHRLGEK